MIRLNVQTRQVVDSSRLSVKERLRILFKLQRYALPFWDKIILRILSTFLLSFLYTVPSLLMPYVIDQALPQGDVALLLKITFIGLGVFALIRVLGVISGTERVDSAGQPSNIMSAYTLPRIAVTIKEHFLQHVQGLSMDFYESRPVGEHMFRSTLDCDDAAYLSSEFIPKTIAAVQRVAVLLFVLQGFGQWLLIPIACYLLFFFTAKHLITGAIRKWDRAYRVETQQLEAVTREILFPWKLVRAYALERQVKSWYGMQACHSVRAAFMRTMLMLWDNYFSFVALGVFVTSLGVLTGWQVLQGEMTLGEHTAVAVLMALVIRPFEDMISTIQLFRQKLVPAERMLETLAVEPTVRDPESSPPFTDVEGNLEVRNLHFAYTPGVPVLQGISLKAEAGEKIALVGPVGAGKSTLLSLLVRLYDPDQGQVLLDGMDSRFVFQEYWRRHFSYAPQGISTFTETIAQNIRYGNPRAQDSLVRQAAHLARVDSFVDEMPEGLETELSEGGSLSGGQKQRLCLARSLVRRSQVMLWDEATSALDPVTEKEVVQELDRAFARRTRIVVAHNMLNARNADRIYVMDKGRIVETGKHEELMQAGGLYSRLWGRDWQEENRED